MSLKQEITVYLATSYNVRQAGRTAYILSLIREKVKGIENPYVAERYLYFEQARQTILKELE